MDGHRIYIYMEVSTNRGTPIAGWSIRHKNPIYMDDLGVYLFQETTIIIYIYIHIYTHRHMFLGSW